MSQSSLRVEAMNAISLFGASKVPDHVPIMAIVVIHIHATSRFKQHVRTKVIHIATNLRYVVLDKGAILAEVRGAGDV